MTRELGQGSKLSEEIWESWMREGAQGKG